ncbi:acyltransferase [Frankia sp. CcI49]|nr:MULTISPECIES: acyltransferase [unclassified Frankia]KPM56634.1 acyltransferase [Frankia sp. R43]ONH62539.1 acyltransferase [Frankia sp. CcI49]
MTAGFRGKLGVATKSVAFAGAGAGAGAVTDGAGPAVESRRGPAGAEPTETSGSSGSAEVTGRSEARSGPPVVFPGFDGLRGIAALLVLVVHVAFYSGLTTGDNAIGTYVARGEIGVEIFFLISGFLLYRPFAAAHLSGRRAPDAPAFFVRRLLRIIPLYWLALAVALNVVPDERMGVHGLKGLVQTALFAQGYRKETAIQGLTQAWTLNIEFAFYLSIPLYAWLLVRRRRSPRAQLRVELAALAVIFVISRVLHYKLIGSDIWWADGWTVWLPVWWDLFAMGMLLAVLSAWYTQNGRSPRWAQWRWFGAACVLAAAFFYWFSSTQLGLPRSPLFIPDRGQDMGRHLFYGLTGFFLLLPAVFGPSDRGLVRRFLACRPMAWLGMISYGIYLWHTTVIDVVVEHISPADGARPFWPFFLMVLGLTCAVSAVTYLLVERPFIALGRWLVGRLRARSRPGGRVGQAAGPGTTAPLATGLTRGVAVSDGGHLGVGGVAAGAVDGDPARTMPLRIGGAGQVRSGDVPATRVPPEDTPGAPAPRAAHRGFGRRDRRDARSRQPSPGGTPEGRRGHFHSQLEDETR